MNPLGKWIVRATDGYNPAVKRILVVDDDTRIVDRLVTLLSERHEAVAASNGFDALKHLDAQPFDVVLLDLRMPGLDGKGLIEALKARGQSLPIVLMSANPNLPEQARKLGITHYLTKPFDLEQLETLVEQV